MGTRDDVVAEMSGDVATRHSVRYGAMTREPHDRQKFISDRVSRPPRAQRHVEGRNRIPRGLFF